MQPCKAKIQYMITLQVIRYCLLALQSSTPGPVTYKLMDSTRIKVAHVEQPSFMTAIYIHTAVSRCQNQDHRLLVYYFLFFYFIKHEMLVRCWLYVATPVQQRTAVVSISLIFLDRLAWLNVLK